MVSAKKEKHYAYAIMLKKDSAQINITTYLYAGTYIFVCYVYVYFSNAKI